MDSESVLTFAVRGVTTVCIIGAVVFVFSLARKEAMRSENKYAQERFVVHAPAMGEQAGWVLIALMSGLLLYFSITGEIGPKPWIMYICFGVFIAGGAFLVFVVRRWRLEVRGDSLVFRPVFGRRRTYNVKDATHFSTTPTGEIKVYAGKRKLFAIDTFMIGSKQFAAYLRKKGVAPKGKIDLQWGDYING